jgi:hypothetical protein
MFSAGICLVLVALLCRSLRRRQRPVDRHELLIIRGLADRIRQDQCHPFG